VSLPDGVEVWDRGRVYEAQRVLAAIPGTTVMLHDQRCAAEKRRDRTRGLIAKPPFRVVINERICEGCGDCGDKSNCLSVQPIDTPYGRKTAIHQTSCNYDFSCMKGDCPAFATVSVDESGKAPKRRTIPVPPDAAELPAPVAIVDPERFTVRLSGIGGTGVITVSQIIGTAAMLEGFEVRGLDQTGLSQKAGPVTSDVRISRDDPAASNHANAAGIDCMLAFDMLAAASDAHREGAVAGRTVVIGSLEVVPTGRMVTHPAETAYPGTGTLRQRLDSVSRPADNRYLDSAAICRGLFGSTTAANILTLGAAVQAGALPLDPGVVERAIELNGVAVQQNIAAFRFGRQWVVDPASVESNAHVDVRTPETLDQLLKRLASDLADYQDDAYAARFRDTIALVRQAEQRVMPESTELSATAARSLHKLMAYKDEYEVARLALLPEMQQKYRDVGGADTDVTYHLHPPMLRSLGLDHKLKFRRTGKPSFAALRAMKRVRGTLADPFRWAEVRRLERAMIPEFERALTTIAERLDSTNFAEAIEIADLPDQVRGYEHIKLGRAKIYREQLAKRIDEFSR
jgi:indolepyruvate ferredoxin oxidoreductase